MGDSPAYAAGEAANMAGMSAKTPAVPQMKQPTELSAKFLKLIENIPGGTIQPCSQLEDPYPEFNGVSIDPKGRIAILSDTNQKSALVYKLNVSADPSSRAPTRYAAWIKGPKTWLSFAAGVGIDPRRHEFYVAENDYGDDLARFPYAAAGDYPAKVLAIPHGAYGVAVSDKYNQVALSIEHNAQLIFYKVDSTLVDLPLRSIRGPHTGMADPHGIFWDEKNGEIVVANYGNYYPGEWNPDYQKGGQYLPPSLTVYRDDAKGDVAPIRTIQGAKTGFNWPNGVTVDDLHNELFVANEISNQILVFPRTAKGNVAPIRIIAGPRTHIDHPMGVAYDPVRDEIWVANFGHTAEIFPRAASGNVAPSRLIRNAPAGSAHAGFGNPMALAYDSKRDELLVPN